MPYGTIKVDNIIFTNSGSDQTVTVSGIVASTSGNLTVTGTISGGTVVGAYGSFTSLTGVTTSGTNANFQTITGAVGVYTTRISGLAITGNTAGFTTVTGTTVTGTTANFVSGVFTSQISGTIITGTTGQFTSVTGGTAGFTTVTGTTVTGTTANFVSGVFTSQISGTTVTGTTANFVSGVFTTQISGATVVATTIELGNASDTTLSRSVAGVLAVEGVVIPSISSTNTLTNKTLTDPAIIGTILEDIYTITDGAAFEVDPGNGSIQLITLGASRTPKATNFTAGESVTLMVNDGTAYTLTWTDTTWGTGGVIWKGGTAPTLATTGYSVIQFWKVSTQVYGVSVGSVA
jgi:hypothetical protein